MPTIATRYRRGLPPLPYAIPRLTGPAPDARVCGNCRRWKTLAVPFPVAGRCTRRPDPRPGIIGQSVTACISYAAKGRRRIRA